MTYTNFKQDLISDIQYLQDETIPVISAKELYGTMFKYLGVLSLFLIASSGFGDYYLIKIGRLHVDDAFDGAVGSALFCGVGWSIFISLGLASSLQKFIIFKKAIMPLMVDTGEEVYSMLKRMIKVICSIYIVILFISAFIAGSFGFSHFFALLGTMFISGAYIDGEISRLAIPELPKIISQHLEGKPVSFS